MGLFHRFSSRVLVIVIVLVLLAVGFVLPACGPREPADLVLFNGKVLTVDESFTIHSAVAVKDGKILAVGDDSIARHYQPKLSVDLAGRTLMPGFMDTHIHIRTQSHRDVPAGDARSIQEIQDMVRAKASELGPGEWITGYGWDEALLSEKRNPVRSDLDAAAPDNPVVLTRAGGHSSVGSSRALEIAGITRTTPDPESGLIEHDDKGEPNGIIRERSDLYRTHVPPDRWEDLRDSYVASLKKLLPLGITSVMDASGAIDDEPLDQGGLEDQGERVTYRRLREIYDREGDDLPRIALYISYPGKERLKAFPHHTGFGDERVRIGPIGESGVDGGFTGPTAWTLVDYKEMPGFRGKGRYTDEELQELVDTSARLGWQMGLHAIGDAAIVQTVNAYSKALRAIVGPGKDHRWFLDHFTVMPPEETMKTMAEDKILIAQQPNFTYNLEGRYVATLDDVRAQHTNSVGTPVKKFGLFVAFGSDNLPIGPMVGLYTAVTRKGMSGTVYGPDEAVSIQEAIRMYTAHGPYLTWEEKVKGTLEPGKLADMIVLASDALTRPPEELLETKVDLTIIGGKIVYDRNPVQ
jgi:predicted amidohydrolase YtcJ